MNAAHEITHEIAGFRASVQINGLAIVPASVDHAPAIARDMRAADRAEGLALQLPSIEGGVAGSIAASAWAYVLLADGEPVAVWGVQELGTILAPRGWAWCLTTCRLEQHRRFFARASRWWMEAAKARHRSLEGLVDARHGASVRWLAWMGFGLSEPFQLPPLGIPFHRFSWERS